MAPMTPPPPSVRSAGPLVTMAAVVGSSVKDNTASLVACYLEPCVCSLSELSESNSCLISISSEEPVYSGRNPTIPSSVTRVSVDWDEVEGPAPEAWNSNEVTRPFSRGLDRIFSMAL